jgi:hypothetical protein
MSQQIPTSRLRKDFLVVGIVFLVMGFFFFYWASRSNWDYVTTHNDAVNLYYPSRSYHDPQWGQSYEYYVRRLDIQPNDYFTVNYPESQYSQIGGTIRIVLRGITADANETTLAFYNGFFLYYTNNPPYDFPFADVYLVASNIQNVTISLTTELNHYETPNWALFGIGVVLSSLAVISISKSKKEA